jgi:hypothetical protein
MGDWHGFLLALAGAAGVLTGLVFVGVSINLERRSCPSRASACPAAPRRP